MNDPAGPAILIVGPGAVGQVLASRWALAGFSVRLLARDAASEAKLVERGLTFITTHGSPRRIHGKLLSARREKGPCAGAFFCVKSYDMAAAIRTAKPWIGPQTAVVSLQNGMGHERLLKRAFGPGRTVVATGYIAADRRDASTCVHTGGREIIVARGKENSRAVEIAAGLLRQGGWSVRVVASEPRMLWTKLCFNAASNPLGAACRALNGELVSDPTLRRLLLEALGEALRIARKTGHTPLYADMPGLILKACGGAPKQRNSMLQDIEEGRRTELAAIVSPLLRAARAAKISAPLLSGLDRTVRSLERLSLTTHARHSA